MKVGRKEDFGTCVPATIKVSNDATQTQRERFETRRFEARNKPGGECYPIVCGRSLSVLVDQQQTVSRGVAQRKADLSAVGCKAAECGSH